VILPYIQMDNLSVMVVVYFQVIAFEVDTRMVAELQKRVQGT